MALELLRKKKSLHYAFCYNLDSIANLGCSLLDSHFLIYVKGYQVLVSLSLTRLSDPYIIS